MEEAKTYLIFDKITPQLRGLISFLLIAAGFIFQISTNNILAGMPFIIACLILNLIKSISIKKISVGNLKWQAVTLAKIVQVLVQCKRIKKFRSKDLGCFIGFIIFMVIILTFILPILREFALPFPLIAAIINTIILFSGLLLSGRKSAWMPHALDIKAEIVKRILDSTIVKSDPMLQAIPYLEIGNTKEGAFPNDARILIKFKDAPAEFIGLQGQISINTVKSTAYPYFYVVLIAKHEFNLSEKFRKLEPKLDNLTIEQKKTEEVDVIVIRQHTTKTSGYHTNQDMQDYILLNTVGIAKKLF